MLGSARIPIIRLIRIINYSTEEIRLYTVIVNGLVGSQNERVALTGVYNERIDYKRLSVNAIGLDNRHIVSIDREGEVWIARDRDETETVSLARFNSYDSQICCQAVSSIISPGAVDKCRISRGNYASLRTNEVIPNYKAELGYN
jgi:hypothetical protein